MALPLFFHGGEQRPGKMISSKKIHLQHFLKGAGWFIADISGDKATRIVDQHIDGNPEGQHPFAKGFRICFFAEIKWPCFNADRWILYGQFLHCLVQGKFIARTKEQGMSLGGKGFRHCFAQSFRCPSDNHIHGPVFYRWQVKDKNDNLPSRSYIVHMKYRHLFFDLDHTLWDFEANSRQTLLELYHTMQLQSKGVDDFDRFHKNYLAHNERLWDRYRNGFIKAEELRWKRMWLTLLDFKIGSEPLAREMGVYFLESLPTRKILFPYAKEILEYLTQKNYQLHLITNGFEKTQHNKLASSGLGLFF